LTITVDRVNIKQRTLSYYSPKTKKYFTVKFHKDLVPILEARVIEVNTGKLLLYKNHTNMGLAFRRYLTELGLNNFGYSMRTFRKTFITNASQSMDLASVSKLVGHSQITTTAKYYTKVNLERQEKEIDKFKVIESAE
jgi:integrase